MRFLIIHNLIVCAIVAAYFFSDEKVNGRSSKALELDAKHEQSLKVENRVIQFLDNFIENDEEITEDSFLQKVKFWSRPKVQKNKTIYSQLKKIYDQKVSKFLGNDYGIILVAVYFAIAKVSLKHM